MRYWSPIGRKRLAPYARNLTVLDGEVYETQQCRDLEEWLPLTDRQWHALKAAGWTLRPLGGC